MDRLGSAGIRRVVIKSDTERDPPARFSLLPPRALLSVLSIRASSRGNKVAAVISADDRSFLLSRLLAHYCGRSRRCTVRRHL